MIINFPLIPKSLRWSFWMLFQDEYICFEVLSCCVCKCLSWKLNFKFQTRSKGVIFKCFYICYFAKKIHPKKCKYLSLLAFFLHILESKTVFHFKSKKSTFKHIQAHLFCFNLFKIVHTFSVIKFNQGAGCLIGSIEPIVWFTLY